MMPLLDIFRTATATASEIPELRRYPPKPLSIVHVRLVFKQGHLCDGTISRHIISLDDFVGVKLRSKSIRSWCDGSSDRSFMGWTHWASSRSSQWVIHDWCNKDRGMCYPVCGMVYIKEPLLLIGKSSLCGGSEFPFSLSEWSFTICLTLYNREIKCVECVVK